MGSRYIQWLPIQLLRLSRLQSPTRGMGNPRNLVSPTGPGHPIRPRLPSSCTQYIHTYTPSNHQIE